MVEKEGPHQCSAFLSCQQGHLSIPVHQQGLGCSSGEALLRSPATAVLIDQFSDACKNFSISSPCLPIFKSSPLHVMVCARELNLYILLCILRVIVLFSCIFSLSSAFLRELASCFCSAFDFFFLHPGVYSTFCLSVCIFTQFHTTNVYLANQLVCFKK